MKYVFKNHHHLHSMVRNEIVYNNNKKNKQKEIANAKLCSFPVEN